MLTQLLRASLLVSSLASVLGPSTAFAHEGCAEDAECASGEVCFEEACSARCESDDDCAEGQVCSDGTACVHEGEAHDEGCSTTGETGSGYALLCFGLVVVAVRRAHARAR